MTKVIHVEGMLSDLWPLSLLFLVDHSNGVDFFNYMMGLVSTESTTDSISFFGSMVLQILLFVAMTKHVWGMRNGLVEMQENFIMPEKSLQYQNTGKKVRLGIWNTSHRKSFGYLYTGFHTNLAFLEQDRQNLVMIFIGTSFANSLMFMSSLTFYLPFRECRHVQP